MLTDDAKTLKWLKRGAELGNVDAQFGLGVAYFLGEGVEQGFLEAYKWFEVSAQGGCGDAPLFRDALAKKMDSSEVVEAEEMARQWIARNALRSRANR